MEVILIQDVENLGFKDEVVSVRNGYGRNFLIPQGIARIATESAKKVLEENLRQRAHKEAKLIDDARKLADKLQKLEFKIESKGGSTGKLFGAVTNTHLAEELSKLGHQVDKRYIQIAGGSIKTAGKASAKIRLHRDADRKSVV